MAGLSAGVLCLVAWVLGLGSRFGLNTAGSTHKTDLTYKTYLTEQPPTHNTQHTTHNTQHTAHKTQDTPPHDGTILPVHLYLIRHGQTAWNSEGRAQGHADIPLDELGMHQAGLLGDSFRTLHLARVLSSDLKRSRMTAEAIVRATGAPLELDAALRERSFGDWEGKSFEEINTLVREAEDKQKVSAFDVVPPGGESFRMVWRRVQPIAEELFRERRHIAVVSHGAACALLLAQLVRGSIETSRAFRFGNTSVTELSRRPDGLFLMHRYNDTTHLETPVIGGDMDGTSK